MTHIPPPVVMDWAQFASDVKLKGRITKPIHIREMFDLRSQSTVMAIWRGQPIGLIPYLRVCKQLRLDPLRYFTEDSK